MNSIVQGRGCPTAGTRADASTVGIELLQHVLHGATVEFYDCAGQVDYYGLHQIFLTRQALYLLVWDVKQCEGKAVEDLDEVSVVESPRTPHEAEHGSCRIPLGEEKGVFSMLVLSTLVYSYISCIDRGRGRSCTYHS